MKLKLKPTPERLEMIGAMGSKNLVTAAEAQEVFAEFITPVMLKVIEQAATHTLFYETLEIDEDASPSIPLDAFRSEAVNYIQTWSQTMPGGLPTNTVESSGEAKVAMFSLDSAVSMLKKWARQHRLDVVTKAVNRMGQEILVKQERNAWAVVLKALGEANTNGLGHVITSTTANVFQVADLSNLIVRGRRIGASFAGGTPDPDPGFGPTDLFVSPEVKGQIRNFAYNPMNSVGSQSTGPVALPNEVRLEIYRSAGASEIFGIAITDLNELGDNQKYTQLFGQFAAAGISHSAANFAAATETICVAVDARKDGAFKLVERSSGGGKLIVSVDDQFAARSDKMGWYAKQVNGFAVVDSRVLFGIIV